MFMWPIVTLLCFAALLHASFQLSVSLLTMLSSHALGAKQPLKTLVSLTCAYILGVVVATTLLFSTLGYFATLFFSANQPTIVWTILASFTVAVGGTVMLFYFRKQNGTQLWLPRGFAEYLAKRAKSATQPEEAFALGATSVLSELMFILAPLGIAAFALARLTAWEQVGGLLAYVALTSLPLIIITCMLSTGKKISSIQRWREQNKHFLQYAAGSGLVVLGLYVFISEVVSQVADGIPLV